MTKVHRNSNVAVPGCVSRSCRVCVHSFCVGCESRPRVAERRVRGSLCDEAGVLSVEKQSEEGLGDKSRQSLSRSRVAGKVVRGRLCGEAGVRGEERQTMSGAMEILGCKFRQSFRVPGWGEGGGRSRRCGEAGVPSVEREARQAAAEGWVGKSRQSLRVPRWREGGCEAGSAARQVFVVWRGRRGGGLRRVWEGNLDNPLELEQRFLGIAPLCLGHRSPV